MIHSVDVVLKMHWEDAVCVFTAGGREVARFDLLALAEERLRDDLTNEERAVAMNRFRDELAKITLSQQPKESP